jgi:hypothetical protein
VGSDVVTASYSGDGNYTASSGSVTQTVNKASTTTTLTSSPNPSNLNQQVTFTATVTGAFGGTPAGTVTFTFGSTTLCSNVSLTARVATCAYSALPGGTDTITATYGGNANYLGSSGTLNQTVNPLSTTTTLTSSPNPSNYQQLVTFTATVTPIPNAGSVTFTYASTTLCSNVGLTNGVATCSSSFLFPVGSDIVRLPTAVTPTILPVAAT